MDIKKWEDCPREDLNMIPSMREAGWLPKFTKQDAYYLRTKPANPPHYNMRFERNNATAYKVYDPAVGLSYKWRVADVVDGKYGNYRDYESLSEVIEKE